MSRSKKNWDQLVNAFGRYKDLIGAEGPKGEQGIKGAKGSPGIKGKAGGVLRFRGFVANQVALDTPQTLPREPGDVWRADEDGVFYVRTQASSWGTLGNLGPLIKGEKGDFGPKGTKGTYGSKGPQGETGDQGYKGNKGSKGEVGFKGDKGQKGIKGAPGLDGQKGQGWSYGDFTSDQLESFKGDPGEQGFKGSKGDEGEKGTKGDPLVFSDLTDDEKREIVGDKGAVGEKGSKGQAGVNGTDGEKGNNGFGVTLKGSVETVDDLPDTDLSVGDLYVVEANYHAYVWDGEGWTDLGTIQGPAGLKGDVGPQGPKGETGSNAVPVGCIMPFAGSSAPSGWLLCDGSAIPGGHTQLIAMVGNNTPNLKGRFLGGAGSNGLTLGNSYNDATRKPRNGSFKITTPTKHRHSFDITKNGISTGSGGGHSHTYDAWGTTKKGGGTGSTNPSSRSTGITTGGTGNHSHSFNLNVTGINTNYQGADEKAASTSNWDSYTRPHTYAVNYIIKHD